jgi:hypothetical protein
MPRLDEGMTSTAESVNQGGIFMAQNPSPPPVIEDPNAVGETYVERVMALQSGHNIILTFMVERVLPGWPKPKLFVTARLVMHYTAANDLMEQMETLRAGIALREAPPAGSS